jgi:YVTN family beta-propeller protein
VTHYQKVTREEIARRNYSEGTTRAYLVRDRHPVCVTAEIAQCVLGPAEWTLGISQVIECDCARSGPYRDLLKYGVGNAIHSNRLYVSNVLDSTVSIVDTLTSAVASISVGRCPGAIAVNTATNAIYVSNWCSRSLQVISGATNSIVAP